MNEIKQLIEESVISLFQNYEDSESVKLLESGSFPDQMWTDFYDGGWTRITLPEEDGGADMGLTGAYILGRIAGYYAVPLPTIEPMLATHLLALAGFPVPEGVLTVATASYEDPFNVEQSELTLQRVPWARHASSVVVVLPAGQNVKIGVVDCPKLAIYPRSNIAGEPRDDLSLNLTLLKDLRELPGVSLERVLSWLALGRAAQMAGSLQKVLERTVDYANERCQFGRPISRFQTIQHMIAVQSEQINAASCAVDTAILHMETAQEWECIASAKIAAGEAAGVASRVSHAVHGAIGFTEEYALQLNTRRLLAWRDEYGNEAQWASKLGELCLGLENGCLWPWLTEQNA